MHDNSGKYNSFQTTQENNGVGNGGGEYHLGEVRDINHQKARNLLPVQQQINNNYISFRETAPLVYDYLTSYCLSSPSRTIEFVRDNGVVDNRLPNHDGYSFVIASKCVEYTYVMKKSRKSKSKSTIDTSMINHNTNSDFINNTNASSLNSSINNGINDAPSY